MLWTEFRWARSYPAMTWRSTWAYLWSVARGEKPIGHAGCDEDPFQVPPPGVPFGCFSEDEVDDPWEEEKLRQWEHEGGAVHEDKH
jgi:hypothetical protein